MLQCCMYIEYEKKERNIQKKKERDKEFRAGVALDPDLEGCR
jgi:hypothetical protein